MTGNPDKALLLRFLDNPGAPAVVDSNPLAAALRCRLLEADPMKGLVRLDFEPDKAFLQGNGAVQGGAVAAMLDFAMAFAALAALPGEQGGATTSMTVNYLKAVRAGRYEAIGRIERKGRSVVFARGELRPVGSEDLAATASSVLAVIS